MFRVGFIFEKWTGFISVILKAQMHAFCNVESLRWIVLMIRTTFVCGLATRFGVHQLRRNQAPLLTDSFMPRVVCCCSAFVGPTLSGSLFRWSFVQISSYRYRDDRFVQNVRGHSGGRLFKRLERDAHGRIEKAIYWLARRAEGEERPRVHFRRVVISTVLQYWLENVCVGSVSDSRCVMLESSAVSGCIVPAPVVGEEARAYEL